MCQHPTHSHSCNCGYVIKAGSDHAIANERRARRAKAEAAIREKYRNATYHPGYNAQLEREALNRLK